jgi:hypothetical protein
MWIKTTLSGILLFIVFIFGFQFNSTPGTTDWSEPRQFFSYPEEAATREFQADVHDETIHVAGGYRVMRKQRFLEDSKIFYLQQDGDARPDVQWLPTENIPVENPALLLDASGIVHLLWGARRQDPEFEQWKTERPQGLGFSTDVIYSSYDGNGFTPPALIYEGHLREQVGGIGDILLPAKWVEDKYGQLHTVFLADSVRTIVTQDGEETVGFTSGTVFMTKNTMGEWSTHRFLEPTALSDIIMLPQGTFVVPYLGSLGPGSINDVLVLTSEDGGDSWSGPNTIFISGQQPGRMLRIDVGPMGRVHLIWGRQTRGLPIPNELWHSYSEDGAQTWSEPERFFQPEQSAQVENMIESFDFVIDSFGRVHWAAVKLQLQDLQGTLYYSNWDPETRTWGATESLDLPEQRPRSIDLALDEASNELNLFWNEMNEDAIFYSTMNLSMPIVPPVIATSGPLQLHANYPNPFNPSTSVSFTIEEQADVELRIFNISGRQILEKDLGMKPAGLHTEEVNLEGFTSGTYIYEIKLNGNWRQQSTMMLVK